MKSVALAIFWHYASRDDLRVMQPCIYILYKEELVFEMSFTARPCPEMLLQQGQNVKQAAAVIHLF